MNLNLVPFTIFIFLLIYTLLFEKRENKPLNVYVLSDNYYFWTVY